MALVSAGSLSASISVGASRGKMIPLFDVSEGLVVPSSAAGVAPSRTVKDLLLRQIVNPSRPGMSVSWGGGSVRIVIYLATT